MFNQKSQKSISALNQSAMNQSALNQSVFNQRRQSKASTKYHRSGDIWSWKYPPAEKTFPSYGFFSEWRQLEMGKYWLVERQCGGESQDALGLLFFLSDCKGAPISLSWPPNAFVFVTVWSLTRETKKRESFLLLISSRGVVLLRPEWWMQYFISLTALIEAFDWSFWLKLLIEAFD